MTKFSFYIIPLLAMTYVGCQAGDSRFENAPTISAKDVRSRNAAHAADAARAKDVAARTAAARPLSEEERRQALPSDHVKIADTDDAKRPSSVAQPTAATAVAGTAGAANSIVQPDSGAIAFDSTDSYGATGPLRWKAPASWRAVRPGNSFRIAEYVIPGANGTSSATMSVFHFPGGGGGIQANIDRWIGQFTPTAGEKSSTTTITVNGLKVWRVSAGGQYNPGMAGGGSGIKEDYALNGAIVETPQGPFFFKLVGPKPTVQGSSSDFETFVKSFKLAD